MAPKVLLRTEIAMRQDLYCDMCICPNCDLFETEECLDGETSCEDCPPKHLVEECVWYRNEDGVDE